MVAFTIRQVEVFLTVCEAGGFRRAADRLDMTEASVSGHVRQLEEALGGPLFLRRRGAANILTPRGSAAREKAMHFLAAAAMLDDVKREDESAPITIRLVVGHHLLEECIGPAVPAFAERYPHINLSFLPMRRPSLLRKALADGEVDCAFLTIPSEEDMPRSTLVSQARFGLFGSPDLLKRQEEMLIRPAVILCDTNIISAEKQISLLKSIGIVDPRIANILFQFPDVAIQQVIRQNALFPTFHSIIKNMTKRINLSCSRKCSLGKDGSSSIHRCHRIWRP